MKDSIIRRPSDPRLAQALKDKLPEYVSRLRVVRGRFPQDSLDEINRRVSDGYKLMILEQVLDDLEIDTSEFLVDLLNHGYVCLDNYHNAAFTIRDYCETGGKNIVGGTGLPFPERKEEWRRARDRRLEEYSIMK